MHSYCIQPDSIIIIQGRMAVHATVEDSLAEHNIAEGSLIVHQTIEGSLTLLRAA